MILSWLLKSMEPEIDQTNMYLSTTKQLWDAMNETYSNLANSLQVYELKTKIGNTTKGNLFVTSYYNMLKSLWQELDLFYDLEWSCAEDNAQYQRTVENDCVNCECLARLAIPDKIPKCPLTRLSNSSSDYLTLKISKIGITQLLLTKIISFISQILRVYIWFFFIFILSCNLFIYIYIYIDR